MKLMCCYVNSLIAPQFERQMLRAAIIKRPYLKSDATKHTPGSHVRVTYELYQFFYNTPEEKSDIIELLRDVTYNYNPDPPDLELSFICDYNVGTPAIWPDKGARL